MFLNPQDISDFLEHPRRFFAAMTDLVPKPGEFAIYQAHILAYSDARPRSCTIQEPSWNMNSGKASSCGLRVYESMPDKCWKTTRRIVISSPPDSPEPACASHWLPLDHVRISVETVKVTISWSDCGQLESIGDQNYGAHHSFIYKAHEPNRKIELRFASKAEARQFKVTILSPTEMPPQVSSKLEICSAFQSARIHRLFDADEPDCHGYHAITSTRKSPQGPHMTEIFYAYRDIDWILVSKNGMPSVVQLPQLCVPHYISTIPKLHYFPRQSDVQPEFSKVVEARGTAHLDLGSDHDLCRFMHALTGWHLKFFRKIERLTLTDTRPLVGSSKTTFKGVSVQLWEKSSSEGPSRIHFAVRLDGEVSNRWITASIVENNYVCKYTTLEIQRIAIQRGVGIDTKEMTARRRVKEDQSSIKPKWKIGMTFKTNSGKCNRFYMGNGLRR